MNTTPDPMATARDQAHQLLRTLETIATANTDQNVRRTAGDYITTVRGLSVWADDHRS